VRRFRFKLEKLLELRGFHERKAELILAERAGRCALLDGKLRETAEARARTGREMFSTGRMLADYRASELYIVRLDRDRDRLTGELAAAELEREAARLDYVEKRKAREVLDKIKERRQGDYYRLAEREEIKALDDLARPKALYGAVGPSIVGGQAGRRTVEAKG
jgi:flagellar protein FliJ